MDQLVNHLQECSQQWNSVNGKGTSLLHSLSSIGLEFQGILVDSDRTMRAVPENSREQAMGKASVVYPQIDSLLCQLTQVYRELAQAIALNRTTLPQHIYTMLDTLLADYRKDLCLKTTIYSDIQSFTKDTLSLHTFQSFKVFQSHSSVRGKEGLLLYVSAWSHEPFINKQLTKNAIQLIRQI